MKLEGFLLYAAQNIVTTAGSVATPLTSGTIARIANLSSTAAEIVYVLLGNAGTVVSAGTGLALGPGQVVYLSREPSTASPPPGVAGGVTHVVLLAAGGTPLVNVSTGEGAP